VNPPSKQNDGQQSGDEDGRGFNGRAEDEPVARHLNDDIDECGHWNAHHRRARVVAERYGAILHLRRDPAVAEKVTRDAADRPHKQPHTRQHHRAAATYAEDLQSIEPARPNSDIHEVQAVCNERDWNNDVQKRHSAEFAGMVFTDVPADFLVEPSRMEHHQPHSLPVGPKQTPALAINPWNLRLAERIQIGRRPALRTTLTLVTTQVVAALLAEEIED